MGLFLCHVLTTLYFCHHPHCQHAHSQRNVTQIDSDEDELVLLPCPRSVASSHVSPVPPDALPSVAFPLKVSGPFFCGVLTSPDFCYHPPLPAPPLLKKHDTKSTATRMSWHHSPIPMEQAVSSYLEWQLNINPSTLRNFNIAFSKISLHRTCLKPPPQTACPRTTQQASCVFVCSNR